MEEQLLNFKSSTLRSSHCSCLVVLAEWKPNLASVFNRISSNASACIYLSAHRFLFWVVNAKLCYMTSDFQSVDPAVAISLLIWIPSSYKDRFKYMYMYQRGINLVIYLGLASKTFYKKSLHGLRHTFSIKLEDLKVLRRSPDLLNNVVIGQGKLQLIMEQILFYHIWGGQAT